MRGRWGRVREGGERDEGGGGGQGVCGAR